MGKPILTVGCTITWARLNKEVKASQVPAFVSMLPACGCNVTSHLVSLSPWTRPPNCGPKSFTLVYCGLTSASRFVVLGPEVREGKAKQQMPYSRPKGERETNPVGPVNCRGEQALPIRHSTLSFSHRKYLQRALSRLLPA